jgi:hypothetical protein
LAPTVVVRCSPRAVQTPELDQKRTDEALDSGPAGKGMDKEGRMDGRTGKIRKREREKIRKKERRKEGKN